MSRIQLVRSEARQLRFIAYNTFCEIVLCGQTAQPGLWEGALETARQVQSLLDAYDEKSELSALCAAEPGLPRAVSGELFSLLEILCAAGQASGGAFDITLGELSRLWNFTASEPGCPAPERLALARARTGLDLITLDRAQKTVTLSARLRLDAGAAGKGYAAGRLAAFLRGQGVRNAWVNLGGNLYLLGPGPRNGLWAVGVQQPWARRGLTLGTLWLKGDTSVSSSGGYDRFFVQQEKVWHHLLDPHTGRPADNGALGCTVVCADALLGDVLSTVLFVGGAQCLRRTAAALCPDIPVGYILARDDFSAEISPELEPVFSPANPRPCDT